MAFKLLVLAAFVSLFCCISAQSCSKYWNKCKSGYVCCNNQCYYGSNCVGRSCSTDDDCATPEPCCSNTCWSSPTDNCLAHACTYDSDCSSGQFCCMYLCSDSKCDSNLGSGLSVVVIGIVFGCIFGIILLIGSVVAIIACCRRRPTVGFVARNQQGIVNTSTATNYRQGPPTPILQGQPYQPPPPQYGAFDPQTGKQVVPPPYEIRVVDSEVETVGKVV